MLRTYIFKLFTNNVYTPCEKDTVVIPYHPSKLLSNLTSLHSFGYSYGKIPNETLSLLTDLLEYNDFKLSDYKDDFISLIMFVQEMYIEHKEIYDDDILLDFKEENKEYENLLNIIEEYLFSKNKVDSIRFKFVRQNNSLKNIKNPNVADAIFKSICRDLGLDRNNFFEVKETLLKSEYHIKHGKGGEYIKQMVIISLADSLKEITSNKTSFSEILKFCGCFLLLCQIPVDNKESQIDLTDISQNFSSIEYQNLQHYYNKRSNFFIR